MVRSPASADRLLGKLRRSIGDERVLAAIATVPRELFVPEKLGRYAWDNTALPIGGGQTISQPVVVARMCELLELRGGETVLDVGTGSGYHAALLARLGREVFSIERRDELAQLARRNLAAAGIANVHVIVGDGAAGYPPAAPYDVINVAAATHEVPAALEDQLADGGRLVAPLDQRLVLERRSGEALERTLLDPVRFVPLVAGED